MAAGVQVSLRPAKDCDTDLVIDHLCRAFPQGPKRCQWYRLFERPWGCGAREDYPSGYLLEVEGRVVGYIATIWAARQLSHRQIISCNLSSWCVDPEYRAMGGALLLAAMRRGGELLTAFTPNPDVQVICEALGFTRLTSHKLLIPTFAHPGTLLRSGSVLTRSADLDATLNAKEQRIRADHARFPLKHYAIMTKTTYAYIVTRRRFRRHVPISEVLFCSEPRILAEQLEKFKLAVLARERSLGIMALPTFISPQPKRAFRVDESLYYKGADLACQDIDLLYSELALIPI